MDLLSLIASEFEIPMVYSKQKVWFFRTKAGRYYFDFLSNNFIALGWDLIPPSLITSLNKGKVSKKEQIEALYPDEKRPGLIFSQMDVFYNKMNIGDLIVIPSEGSKEIAVGKIGELIDNVVRSTNDDEDEYPHCTYHHKRNVEWLKKVNASQDVYLFKAIRAQQTISDITEESKLILRNLYPLYISGNSIHLTLQKPTENDLGLAQNVDLLSSILHIADCAASLYGKESFRNEISVKTAVGSPGFFELILPDIPIAAIAICLIKWLIGKEKTSKGATTTGILAIITKINELVNDYHNRKKIDAESRLIDAQTEKTKAERDLLIAQISKTNAEIRQLEFQNTQVSLLPSGKTTEQEREESEYLIIPHHDSVTTNTNNIVMKGELLCKAAENSGLSYNGEKIKKIS